MKRVIVFNVGDHDSGGPSGVCAQSSAHVRTHLTASNQPIRARLWKRFGVAGHKRRKGAKRPDGASGWLGDELLTLGTRLLQHGQSHNSNTSADLF
jgi:hypothetical protein